MANPKAPVEPRLRPDSVFSNANPQYHPAILPFGDIEDDYRTDLRLRRCSGPCYSKSGHKWYEQVFPKAPDDSAAVYCRLCIALINDSDNEKKRSVYYCKWWPCRKYQICRACHENIEIFENNGKGMTGTEEDDDLRTDKDVPLPESEVEASNWTREKDVTASQLAEK